MKRDPITTAAILVPVAAVVAAGVWWWMSREPAPEPTKTPPVVAQAPAAPSSAASEPAIRYPIEAAEPDRSAQPLDIAGALDDLFGPGTVASMLQVDDFARRFVATIDNLGRSTASARLWPVVPSPGRFTVAGAGGGTTIAVANEARYEPFVRVIEGVDLRRAVGAYAQLYPTFQQAYEKLGYPGRYFNDRFVDVIDVLLAAPEPATAPKVHLPTANAPVRPQRPWVLYEFDDPRLESLSAGQKILVRMGAANERRVKAKLAELRGLLTSAAARR
jgi:hypothetical protein